MNFNRNVDEELNRLCPLKRVARFYSRYNAEYLLRTNISNA